MKTSSEAVVFNILRDKRRYYNHKCYKQHDAKRNILGTKSRLWESQRQGPDPGIQRGVWETKRANENIGDHGAARTSALGVPGALGARGTPGVRP